MKILSLFFFLAFAISGSCFAQNKTLFPIEQKGKTGYIDNTGKIVIKPQFDDGWDFSEGLAPVRVDDEWGYIDVTGKIVIEPRFFQASVFIEGLSSVGVYFEARKVINGKVGYYNYINKRGDLISKERFEVAADFSEGLADVLTGDYKHGYIDQTGKIVFYFNTYDMYFHDGLAMFKTNGNMPDTKVGYVNKKGEIAIDAKFDSGEEFSEGLACAYLNGKAGFINTNGDAVIDFKFDGCRNFSDGLAAVYINGKWGYIDKWGKIVIEPQFIEVNEFSDDVAIVFVGEEKRFTEGDRILVKREGSYGVIDKNGTMIIPPKFNQINDFHNGLAIVNFGDGYIVCGSFSKWGYINKSGKIVWKSF